jgi:putative phosphoribosyl transferase
VFRDRADAGHLLGAMVASQLSQPSGVPDVTDLAGGGRGSEGAVVLGLARGGVPVAAVVAQALGLPLDVLVVRKIGLPSQPELALGAVGENGAVVLNEDVMAVGGVRPGELDTLIGKASAEVGEIVTQLRRRAGALELNGRMVIVVDDGVATGATVRAAASVLRSIGSGPVVLATPVAALSTCQSLRSHFDQVICMTTPSRFGSVGQWYEQFEQVSIAQVRRFLEASPA